MGGGQLGRMLGLAGIPLGLRFRFLDPVAGAPAGEVGELVVAPYEDAHRLAGVDVLTYEFENVPVAAVAGLANVWPPPAALELSQDRLVEKRLFAELRIATPRFGESVAETGLPALAKTRRLGYDGKGQRLVRTEEEARRAVVELGGEVIFEELVAFRRELSLLAVRSRAGETAFYPLVENEHAEGILRLSRAPAAGAPQREAEAYGTALLDRLGYAGVLALELFETADGRLLANELAPRVHNSGHWTIEGAATSQFENHLRAILGLPLGSTAVRRSAMVNLIGVAPPLERLLAIPGAHVHLYGKSPRPGRKLGHVTLVDAAVEQLAALAELG